MSAYVFLDRQKVVVLTGILGERGSYCREIPRILEEANLM
jgi:hypothetical protein